MKLPIFIFVPLFLVGCARPDHAASAHPPTAAVAPAARSLDAFRFNWPTTTVQDVIAKLGAPDRDVGSGIYILEDRLQDGSRVWIGSPNNSQTLYVRHGAASVGESEVVYERR